MEKMIKLLTLISVFISVSSCTPVKFNKQDQASKVEPPPPPPLRPTETPTDPTPPIITDPTPTPTEPPVTYIEKTKTLNVDKNMTQIDLLLIVDDSSSMEADNARLASRLSGFVNILSNSNLDWQMCITTTDVQYYAGLPLEWSGLSNHILTSKAAHLSSIIQQTIYDIGSGYSNDEQGIKATYLNISKNASHHCHREGSTLATIIISDEDERSVGGVYNLSSAQYKALTSENQPDTLISFVQSQLATQATTKKFKMNSIVVQDASCEALQDKEGSPSFIGKNYIDLAQKTKGSVGSICDQDFTNNLNVFSDILKNTVSSVKLDCIPVLPSELTGVPNTIKTTTKEDVISFDPALEEGTTVTVKYKCAK